MNWNRLKISTRLGIAFGLVFLAMAMLIVFSYASTKDAVHRMNATIEQLNSKSHAIEGMHLALLNAGVAVRNLSLIHI